ncbi:unnamed protein product [Ceratitis capitata]|uniref:(Mediterranean fruit fly) hypothetical protein n=1 Tax=Ceratitis capitata TaxID=7213 RepID=A0A811V9E6_CERCA|nr:unnamed protein product [Ceratitis capitata]
MTAGVEKSDISEPNEDKPKEHKMLWHLSVAHSTAHRHNAPQQRLTTNNQQQQQQQQQRHVLKRGRKRH